MNIPDKTIDWLKNWDDISELPECYQPRHIPAILMALQKMQQEADKK